MIGLSWTEILVIAVVALIVIGPKDLPLVMKKVGTVVGQLRRMGSEFQRELNKATGLDEVRNLRQSITDPLRKSSEEIRREFNAMTPKGPKPSGLIKPADPDAQSIDKELRAAAGLPERPAPALPAPEGEAQGDVSSASETAPVRKPAVKAARPAVRMTPIKDSAVTRAELVDLKPDGDASGVPASAPKPVRKPAAKKPGAKKPGAKKPSAKETVDAAAPEAPAKPARVRKPRTKAPAPEPKQSEPATSPSPPVPPAGEA